jgi:hypothetical protein
LHPAIDDILTLKIIEALVLNPLLKIVTIALYHEHGIDTFTDAAYAEAGLVLIITYAVPAPIIVHKFLIIAFTFRGI